MAKSINPVPPLDTLRRERLRARAALDVVGKLAFKPLSSAKWIVVTTASGALRVQIEHDNIQGVAPEMLQWWFENLAGTTTWNGKDFSGPEIYHYHLWHHRDHKRITPVSDAPDGTRNNGFRVGALTRIVKQFNGYREHVAQTLLTTRLDTSEFNFDILSPDGTSAGFITHQYAPVPGGVSFYAEIMMNFRPPVIGPLLNRLPGQLVFSRTKAEHWITHDIEKTGRTQDILPILYAAAHSSMAA